MSNDPSSAVPGLSEEGADNRGTETHVGWRLSMS